MSPRIEVIIPTLDRQDRLARVLDSIHAFSPQAEVIVSRETAPRALPVIVNELIARSTADIVITGADSCEWIGNVAGIVADAMAAHFPDLDGVIGLNQTNVKPVPGCTEYAFVAIGRKFLDRFPGGEIYCPAYWHFYADTEFGLLASELGRFYFEPRATVVHDSLTVKDSTYHASRRERSEDSKTWLRRRASGLLWGKDFTL